jgi:hypothetical protein
MLGRYGHCLGRIAVVFVCAGLSGCSYLFHREVKGTLNYNGSPVVGYINYFSSDHKNGDISLGTVQREDCRGIFKVAKEELSLFGFAFGERIYKGQMYCLDGRVGEIEFISKPPEADGKSGVLRGKIGNDTFTVEILKDGNLCDATRCKYGPDWSGPSEKWRIAFERFKSRT